LNRRFGSRLLRAVLLVGALSLARSTEAGDAARPTDASSQRVESTQPTEELSELWKRVNALVAQGAYRDALQTLDLIRAKAPDDPWAALYRSLCERRLRSSTSLPQLRPDQFEALTQQLQREAIDERRRSAARKALERAIRAEQARWDRELAAAQRQIAREHELKRKEEQAQALAQAQAMREQIRDAAKQRAATLTSPGLAGRFPQRQAHPAEATARSPVARPESEAPRPASPASERVEMSSTAEQEPTPQEQEPTPQPSVELAPVVVTTSTPPATEQQPVSPVAQTDTVSPSLAKRPAPPPGAVQINAKQMSVAPDRKVAVAEGDVEVIYNNTVVTCDRLTLFTDTKDLYAEGRVRIEEGQQVFRGELVHYNLQNKKGRFLQGTVATPPWFEHGRSVEHIAEGVLRVSPGYLTSCELEPPHFKFQGRRAIVFADDKLVRSRNAALFVEEFPLLYFPWLSFADRQSPFFIIPGKKKPWEQFALMGYRYKWPQDQKGTIHLDWRRAFAWGVGLDHQIENTSFGKGLLKLYYNQEHNMRRKEDELPKGAGDNRYRVLWRHFWKPLPDTTVVTDLQKYSDVDYREEFLFREEYTAENVSESFISAVTSTKDYALGTLVRRRLNRFQTVTDALPQVTLQVPQKPIGLTRLFSGTTVEVANLQTKRAHSDNDTDVVRVDWLQQFKYVLGLLRPIEVTPKADIHQTYYTKDKQGGIERPDGMRDLIAGQFGTGVDASLKLFRVFPVVTNAWGLNFNWLRHVLTPTVSYAYLHQPTVPPESLSFPAASGTSNIITFGLENKLQTKRPAGKKLRSVDLLRSTVSIPYTYRGHGNKQGGRLGDWLFDVETYPWPWLRVETDWTYPSHFLTGSRDGRIPTWNLDVVMVGGKGQPQAQHASDIQAPARQTFAAGPSPEADLTPIPQGQWYLGYGHRYSQNDRTEDVLQFDVGLSKKWQVSTFHRLTWKEVSGGSKRFANLREYQYKLRRDLHDWFAELVWRVDRELGEEVYFTLTLKAYPDLPIETSESYHQPKLGSQSSPFSPLRGQLAP